MPKYALCSAAAVPTAKPTDIPSGILWIVMAVKSLKGFWWFDLMNLLLIKSKTIMKTPPSKKPKQTGMIESLPQLAFAFSIDGIRSDQIEAESIMPDAMPIVILFSVFEGFEKKNIRDAPSVVSRHGRVKDNIIAVVRSIFFCVSPVIQFMARRDF